MLLLYFKIKLVLSILGLVFDEETAKMNHSTFFIQVTDYESSLIEKLHSDSVENQLDAIRYTILPSFCCDNTPNSPGKK